jgi:hypothetical protein
LFPIIPESYSIHRSLFFKILLLSLQKKTSKAQPSLGRDAGDEIADDDNSLLLLLPKEESMFFHRLFSSLEKEKVRKQLGILSYRLKLYSMREAFDE